MVTFEEVTWWRYSTWCPPWPTPRQQQSSSQHLSQIPRRGIKHDLSQLRNQLSRHFAGDRALRRPRLQSARFLRLADQTLELPRRIRPGAFALVHVLSGLASFCVFTSFESEMHRLLRWVLVRRKAVIRSFACILYTVDSRNAAAHCQSKTLL